MTPFVFDGLGMGMTCTPDLELLFKSDLRALALFVSLGRVFGVSQRVQAVQMASKSASFGYVKGFVIQSCYAKFSAQRF